MYKDLIKKICEKEGLIDISYLGEASKSIEPVWLRDNELQNIKERCESDGLVDYNELGPWWQIKWQIEFNTIVLPEYITITSKAKDVSKETLGGLKVIISDNENTDTVLHEGEASLQDASLILPLKRKIGIKRIKVSIVSQNLSDLLNIEALVRNNSVFERKIQNSNGNLITIASRTDGFGERLRTILNGIVLANELGTNFVFTWASNFSKSEFHAIDKVDEIFSKEFINENYIDRDDLLNSGLELLPLRSINNLKDVSETGGTKKGITLDQNQLSSQVKDKSLDIKENYQIAFGKIEFSEKINTAIDLAKSISLDSKVIAIHLRTGDLVYGVYRNMDRYYGKVVPFYALDYLIKYYQDLGYSIILFSLETVALKYFKDKYGVMLSSDFIDKSYDKSQMAMFDIMLMSRCNEIVCGSSGFAIVASWIGGSKICMYKEMIRKGVFSKAEIQKSFKESLKEGFLSYETTDRLLKAFSNVHFAQSFKEDLASEQRLVLLKDSVYLDPLNSFYIPLLAIELYKNNNYNEADNLLIKALGSKERHNLRWLTKERFPKVTIMSSFIDEFKKYAKSGSVVAAYIAYISEINSDGTDSVDNNFYIEIISKYSDTKSIYLFNDTALVKRT